MAVSIALLVGTVYLFTIVPKGFLPSEDQGRFNVSTEAIQGIGFDEMVRHQQQVADIVAKDPNVSGVQQQRRRRARRRRPEHRPHHRRPEAARRAQADRSIRSSRELRPKLAQVPGIRVFMVNQPPINLGGQQGARSLYQFTLQDTDTDGAVSRGRRSSKTRCASIPGLEDVSSDLQLKNPQVTVDMDRDKISALGLTVNQVETALYNAYGTRQVSQIYAPNNQYQVILQVAPRVPERSGGAVACSTCARPAGRLIPLEHGREGDDRRRAARPSATPASCRRSRSRST